MEERVLVIGVDIPKLTEEQKAIDAFIAEIDTLYNKAKKYRFVIPNFQELPTVGRKKMYNGNCVSKTDDVEMREHLTKWRRGIYSRLDESWSWLSNWVGAGSTDLQEIIKYADLATQQVINPLDGTNSTVSDVNDLKAFFDYLICKLKEYIDYKNQVTAQQSQPQSQGCFVNLSDAIQAKEIAEQEILVLKAELEETKKRITELEARLNQNN